MQMPPEQQVEQRILSRRKLAAEPPVPVAPLRDVELLPRPVQNFGRGLLLLRCLLQELAGRMQEIPGSPVFLVPDPDREVVRDPAAGEKLSDAIGRGIF